SIAHSHGEPWLFAATERLQPAYGYGLWKAKIPSEKMCSIAVCGGAGCEERVTRRVQTRLERKRTGPHEWLVVTRRPLADEGTLAGQSSPDARGFCRKFSFKVIC